MKRLNNKDTHPFAINIIKLQRYNFEFLNCEEAVFFEYIVIKGMAFKKLTEFFHSSETIRKETGIKKHSLNTIVKRFEELNIISTVVKGMPRVKYFTVHFPEIIELLPNIYLSSENGQLSPDFSKHLADFFIPLVDNYQKKNNIKNNNKENIKEKKDLVLESDRDFFNNFLSQLKNKNKISPEVLKFNEIDLFRALNEYDIELLCEYIKKYFKETLTPTLKQFFIFDTISPNKIKILEEIRFEEENYVDSLIENLQDMYNNRIKIYNQNKAYKSAKSNTRLAVTNQLKTKVKEALNVKSEIEITNAFTAYIDEILNGELNVRKILPYFFVINDGEYDVINTYLDFFNVNYSYLKK